MSSPVPTTQNESSDLRVALPFVAAASAAAIALIAYLLYGHRSATGIDLRFMPALNASFNGATAVLLTSAWIAIRRQNKRLHRALMLSAGVTSTLFLLGYLTYHYVHGDTRYAGHGPLRSIYLFVLASHILLSMVVLPGVMLAYYLAFKQKFTAHRKVTRWLMPVWLYVSVTGVIVFVMLRGSLPSVH